MVDLINTLISECLDRHAPLPRGYMRLISDSYKLREINRDWMRTMRIMMNHGLLSGLSLKRLRWLLVKRSFFMTALSSKRPKQVWRVIHRVLNPSTSPPRADPDQLNKYFIATNERTLGITSDATSDLLELAESLPEHSQRSFKLCDVTFEDVMKERHHLRSDCSTGVDQIPVKIVKLVSEHIAHFGKE